MADTLKVLVTGSNGFVGGHTVEHLSRESGISVISATRDGRAGTRRLDMLDPAGMSAALSGVDAIVHCAVGNRAVTVAGTHALLLAAAAAGVQRFIHISTIAVYGVAEGRVDETSPMASPDGNGYGPWKIAAEQSCLAQTAVQTVRLRPSIVYGPGGMLWVGQYARRIRSGRWGVFGEAGEGTCNPVHVSDVAGAIAAALVSRDAVGRAFNVNGPESTTWNGWFTKLAEMMDAPPLPTIAPGVLRARAYASLPLKAVARVWPSFGRDWLLGAPSRSEISLFAHRATYPVDAAREVMGWAPSISIDDGLANTRPWLHAQGLAAATVESAANTHTVA